MLQQTEVLRCDVRKEKGTVCNNLARRIHSFMSKVAN